MGLLDDAIREHLDLKRRRGADPTEIERLEREALGPVRREPLAGEQALSEPPGAYAIAEAEPYRESTDDFEHVRAEVDYEEPEIEPVGLEPQPPIAEHSFEEPSAEATDEHEAHGKKRFGFLHRSHKPDPAIPFDDDQRPAADLAGGGLGTDDFPFADPQPGGSEAAAETPSTPKPTSADNPPPAPDVELGHEPDDHAAASETPPRTPSETGSAPPPLEMEPGATVEYDVETAFKAEDDVLEETPEFLQDTPDHDRLWFEQKPPKDFDFDA
jgi:hypothetical protein